MLLSVAYFPPVEYFALLAGYSSVYVEACENYQKQSWRNRCRILTANGTQDLNVPVVHENGTFALPIRQIRVDYSTPWVIRTERAIESAYSSSPFFIYYKDELFGILDYRPKTIWELDMRLIRFFCAKIGIAPDIRETLSFVPPLAGQVSGNPGFAASSAGEDYRQAIHPKRPNTILADLGLDRPYWQVFRERFGFVPGLSVMDLLFNEGPESICWLR